MEDDEEATVIEDPTAGMDKLVLGKLTKNQLIAHVLAMRKNFPVTVPVPATAEGAVYELKMKKLEQDYSTKFTELEAEVEKAEAQTRITKDFVETMADHMFASIDRHQNLVLPLLAEKLYTTKKSGDYHTGFYKAKKMICNNVCNALESFPPQMNEMIDTLAILGETVNRRWKEGMGVPGRVRLLID